MKRIPRILIAGAIFVLFGLRTLAGEGGLYFPPVDGEWETIKPSEAGWDEDKLQLALNYAGENQSSGVVVLYRGRILAEQYWDAQAIRSAKYSARILGRDKAGRPIEDVASAQKSVTSILVGIAQQKGLLKIDDRVDEYLGPGWSRATLEQEAAISIRHLITMSSGLSLRGTFEAPAGTKWRYNTGVYAKSMEVLEKAAGMDRHELTRKWLTEPLGMLDSKWVRRGSPALQQVNGFGFASTARDLARFGLMALADGSWDGEAILSDRQYLKEATSSSQKLNPFYGYLWWLNRDAFDSEKAPRLATAPIDMFSANGALNRRCFVVPSLQLIVTRIGDQPKANKTFDRAFWKLLMDAAN